ncbi:thioredoxin family protein [Phocaeicola sp.]
MDIAKQINDAKQSDYLTLLVFYADWSPHYEWIEPVIHEFESPINIIRINTEGDKKVANEFDIKIVPSFVLIKRGNILWEKTGEVFPGELKDVIEMFKG